MPFSSAPVARGAAVRPVRLGYARPAPRSAVPDPGGLLRGRVRAARGPPRGRPGRAQPHAPPGLPEVGLRRRLPGRARPGVPVQLRLRRLAVSPPGARRVAARPSGSPRAALDGYVERSVGAATHYHADYVAPLLGAAAGQDRASSARISSIAGRAPGARPPPSPAAISASRTTRCRCGRRFGRRC